LEEFATFHATTEAIDIYLVSFATKVVYRRGRKKKWCLLVLMRIVIWVRFGWLCGILASPYVEIYAQASALAKFFSAQHWPAATRNCPVLLLGLKEVKLIDIKNAMIAQGEQHRAAKLKSTDLTGSQWRIMKDFDLKRFVASPKSFDHTLLLKRAAHIVFRSGMATSVQQAFDRPTKPLNAAQLCATLYP